MNALKLSSLVFAAALLTASSVLAEDGWVDLFNGKNLDGWEEHSGKAKYTVEDGVLTGESVSGSGNSHNSRPTRRLRGAATSKILPANRKISSSNSSRRTRTRRAVRSLADFSRSR